MIEVFLLTALAGVLRFWRLGAKSLWLDEVLTVNDAAHPFAQIHRVVLASPPLFHYLLRCVYLVVGRNDFWLRMPSAIFGTLTIPIFYWSLRRLFDQRTAVAGGLLLALSPFHIGYSQELRMWVLAALIAWISLWLWNEALERDEWRFWIGYTVVSLAGLYTSNWHIFFLISQTLWSMFLWRRGKVRGKSLGVYAAIAVLYLPWVPWLWVQAHRPVFGHMARPGWAEIRDTWLALCGWRVTIGDGTFQTSSWLLLWSAALSLAAVAIGLRVEGKERSRVNRLFWIGAVLPLALAFLESRLVKPIFLPSRYTLLAVPAFLVPVARGLWGNGPPSLFRRCAAALGILWLVCSGFMIQLYFLSFEKAFWKPMAQWIQTQGRPGDGVDLSPLGTGGITLDYYLPETISRGPYLRTASGPDRIFFPFYGRFNAAGRFPSLGPKGAREWRVVAMQTFSNVSIMILERRH